MLNGIILFSLSLLLGVSNVKKRPETLFQLLTSTFDQFFNVKWGIILLQRPYISFRSPLLLFLRQEITAPAVALFYLNSKGMLEF